MHTFTLPNPDLILELVRRGLSISEDTQKNADGLGSETVLRMENDGCVSIHTHMPIESIHTHAYKIYTFTPAYRI